MSLPGTNTVVAPDAGESVTTPDPVPQLTDSSSDSPTLDGIASLPVPPGMEMTKLPRQLTRERVPALSQEETDDGLHHGRKSLWAL